jgi:hypothetical protein
MASTAEKEEVAMFGCWGDEHNNGGIPMKRVLSTIQSTKIPHLIIAGDNYYVEKRERMIDGAMDKKKIFDVSIVRDIFKSLPDIDIDILNGNHETDPTDMYTDVDGELTIVPDKCNVLKTELQLIQELNDTRTHPIHLRMLTLKDSLCRIINDDCYLFIDSSMFEYRNEGEMTCYYEILGPGDNIISYRNLQLDYILSSLNELKSDFNRVFLVAHHPICTFRYKPSSEFPKPKKESGETNVNIELIQFLHELITKGRLNDHPIHYLCADFHVYQHQTITLNGIPIDVHIVGTGGAEQDDFFTLDKDINLLSKSLSKNVPTDPDANVMISNGNFVITVPSLQFTAIQVPEENRKEYGYLSITDTIQFISVPLRGGKRTKKKKNKRVSRNKSRR